MGAAPSRPSMAEGPDTGLRLAELLALGRRLWEELEAGVEPSSAAQEKVRQGLDALQQAAAMVAQLELFSENEELEEIASADLKYLLLPALLGSLTLKQVNLSRRLEHLESARTHFTHFLRLCNSYGLGSFQLPPANPPGEERAGGLAPGGPADAQASLLAMASNRQAKIERYKQKKELENRLASMRTFVESGQADEEQIREFYIIQIQKWINTSLEEIESIDQEIVILRSRGSMKQPPAPPRGTPWQVRTPLKPFVLFRNTAQAKVFGAGYPSLPTMTVDDWYNQCRRQGVMSGQSTPQRAPGSISDEELQKQQQEKKEEEDDEEARQKAQNWDDWKDTHPRGYGNRQNMG